LKEHTIRIQYEALLNTARGVINASTYSEGYTIAGIYVTQHIDINPCPELHKQGMGVRGC
jgi:hypothetical protein